MIKTIISFTVFLFVILIPLLLLLYANWPSPQLTDNQIADEIIVDKSDRKLRLYSKDKMIAEYAVAFGKVKGRKEREGDNKTPEGLYKIDFHKPDSAFHRALHISYPNQEDIKSGRTGTNVMIHGIRNGLGFIGRFQQFIDWSRGCISLNNDDMDEIYGAVPDGTPVEIQP